MLGESEAPPTLVPEVSRPGARSCRFRGGRRPEGGRSPPRDTRRVAHRRCRPACFRPARPRRGMARDPADIVAGGPPSACLRVARVRRRSQRGPVHTRGRCGPDRPGQPRAAGRHVASARGHPGRRWRVHGHQRTLARADRAFDRDRHDRQVNSPRGTLTNWNNAPAPGWGAADNQYAYGSTHRVALPKPGWPSDASTISPP